MHFASWLERLLWVLIVALCVSFVTIAWMNV